MLSIISDAPLFFESLKKKNRLLEEDLTPCILQAESCLEQNVQDCLF